LFLPAIEPWQMARLWLIRAAWAALAAGSVLAGARWKAGKRDGAGTYWLQLLGLTVAMFAALLPATGLVVHPHDGQGERLLYLASAPVSIAVASTVGYLLTARWLALGTLSIVAAAGALSLRAPIERWREAGRIAAETIQVIRTESTGLRVAVLDLPDNYEGAYVLRNGFTDALNASRPEAERFTADVPSLIGIGRHPVEIELSRHGEERWRFAVLSNEGDFALAEGSPIRAEMLAGGRSFLVSESDLAQRTDLYVFEGHALRRLDPPAVVPAAPLPAVAAAAER
jgi:hypothetical protein